MFLLLFACAHPTLQPVVEAEAAAIRDDASLAVARALGGAAVVASVCADTQSDWRQRGGTTLSLPAEVSGLLGRSDVADVAYDDSSGQAQVIWAEDADGVQLRLVVDRPQSSFILREQVLSDTGSPAQSLELRYTSDGCRESPSVGLSGSLDEPYFPSSLSDDAPLVFATLGAIAPSSGAMSWQDASLRARRLTTDDAASLSDWRWSASAIGEDWTWPVELELQPAQ